MKTTLFIAFFALISSLQISQKGLNLIKEFEGCKLEAYKCPAGVWTIGYGTTDSDYSITKTKIKAGLKISKQKADIVLKLINIIINIIGLKMNLMLWSVSLII